MLSGLIGCLRLDINPPPKGPPQPDRARALHLHGYVVRAVLAPRDLKNAFTAVLPSYYDRGASQNSASAGSLVRIPEPSDCQAVRVRSFHILR